MLFYWGEVANNEIPQYLKLAEVVVFPSTAESSSIACAEAMAMKKKIIASRVGGLVELLGENEDSSFDLVASSHVLEHLPDFDQGLKEIMRVTKKRAVIAIPTILNLCSVVQVGRGWFYLKGPKSFLAFSRGLNKVLWAFVFGKEGVDESYGREDIPHLFRFPWMMRRKLRKMGFYLVGYEASAICLPYFSSFLPVMKFLDRYKDRSFLRNFGYGTTYIIEKR